jgi:hypothetical protein
VVIEILLIVVAPEDVLGEIRKTVARISIVRKRRAHAWGLLGGS